MSWRDAQAALVERKATNDARLHLEKALSFLKDAETGQRGFLLTRDPKFLTPYDEGRGQVRGEYERVEASCRGDREVATILEQVRPLVAAKRAEMEATLQASQHGAGEPGYPELSLARGMRLMDAIRTEHEQLGLLLTAQALDADARATERFRRTLRDMGVLTVLSFAGIGFFVFRANRFERSLVERSAALEAQILQRTEAEGETRRVNGELLASNGELEAFASSVAHDLRAPLRHVSGFARLLRRDMAGASPKASHCLDRIQAAALGMGALIDDLLTYSRLGRMDVRKVPVPLATLLEQVRADLEEDHGVRNVRWAIGPLPTVLGDPILLRLALQNLLSNALKFTRQRDPALLEVGSRVQEGITFFVKDNGTGFDMAFLDKLFKPFQRLHPQEEFEGTGIGLANVARVAARHGGRAWAEGAPGAGATFYLYIPGEVS